MRIKVQVKEMVFAQGEVLVMRFKPLDGASVHYLAGQFLTLVFHPQGREVRRSYSICSEPDTDEPLSIAIKRIENGEISRFLHHKITIGDVLTAIAPNGIFTYLPKANQARSVFLFAAGVGITPLFSILKTALHQETRSHVNLIYSTRLENDALFHEELQTIKESYPDRFNLIYVSSAAKNLFYARLNVFLIEKVVNEHLKFDSSDALFYTCGPGDYMLTCRITLLKLGFAASQIKRETFVLEEDEIDEDDTTERAVQDMNSYRVNLRYKGESFDFTVPYNKTILDVALENGIDLPYSCRAGLCSSCTATCTEGEVHMDYNGVLLDNEVAAGRVLVCTAHPRRNGTRIVW